MVPPAFLRSLAGIIYGVSQLRRENLRDRSDVFLTLLKIESENYLRKWSGRRGSNPQLPAWEGKYSTLCFQHLQNRSQKMHVHALHTVHALPDLRITAGRFAGRC